MSSMLCSFAAFPCLPAGRQVSLFLFGQAKRKRKMRTALKLKEKVSTREGKAE